MEKRRINQIILFLIVLSISSILFDQTAYATNGSLEATGTFSNNFEWSLVNDVLTVSGSGEMNFYDQPDSAAPWLIYKQDIKKVILEEGIESVAPGAFEGYENLTDVSFPETMKKIGNFAFYNCINLCNVVFPDRLERIGDSAFASTSINTLEFPDSLTYIEFSAFSNIEIEELTLPSTIKTYNGCVFQECDKLKSVTVEAGTENLGWGIFLNCTNLTEVKLPDTLVELDGTFSGCTALSNIKIPNNVECITGGVFDGCVSLENIEIPAGVKIIGGESFYGCTNLKKIYLKNSLVNIQEFAFPECIAIEDVYFDGYINEWFKIDIAVEGNEALLAARLHYNTDNILASGECDIPVGWTITSDGSLYIFGYGVMPTYYDDEDEENVPEWLNYNDKIKSIVIKKGITSITDGSFQNCSNLLSIYIPETVTDIKTNAFNECSSLETISVHEMNTAFCNDSKGILFNKNKSTLFYAPMTISGEYIIADTVQEIKPLAFYGCNNLTSVAIPEGITELYSTFWNCTSLSNVELPDSLQILGNNVFWGCSSLQSISIPKDVTKFGSQVFYCSGIAEISIPASVEYIDYMALAYCDNLTKVIFEGNVPKFGNYVFSNNNMKAYYPVNNSTWKESVKQNYNGTITWVAYGDRYFGIPNPTTSCVTSSGKIKLSWDAIDDAISYKIYRAESKNGTYVLMKTTSNTYYINTSAKAGEKYYYYVIAIAEDGSASRASEIVSRTCDLAKPVIKMTSVTKTGKIKVSWNRIPGAVKYEVYRATSKNGTYKLKMTTTNNYYINTDAKAGNTYYYKVKAIAENTAANSAFSSAKYRTCDLPQPKVSITLSKAGKPKLVWNKIDGAVAYKVYRYNSSLKKYVLLKTTTNTSFINTSATTGKTYYYKIVAVASNTAANSAYSNMKSIKSK